MTNEISIKKMVGINLKKLIKESKFKTQEKFACEGMHVDPTTVRKWIKNGIESIVTISEIARILDVSFMELLK